MFRGRLILQLRGSWPSFANLSDTTTDSSIFGASFWELVSTMGSYRDALLENLTGATTLAQAKGETTSEEEKRERRAEAATQRAAMEGYFPIEVLGNDRIQPQRFG